jgi:hypothetical protein
VSAMGAPQPLLGDQLSAGRHRHRACPIGFLAMWPAQRLIASNGIGDAGELSLLWRTFSGSLVVDVLTGEGSWGEMGRVHPGVLTSASPGLLS